MSAVARHLALLTALLAGCPTPPLDPRPRVPTIGRFEADPQVLEGPATTTTLRWQVEDADVVRLEGTDEPATLEAEGSRTLTLVQTTTLTLVAENAAGAARAALVVRHDGTSPVRLDRFELIPPKVRVGDRVMVVWDAPGARAVSIVSGTEQAVVLGGAARGVAAYLPLASGVLALTAEGWGGPITATRAVALVEAPPLLEALTITPVVGTVADVFVVRWAARGAVERCTLSAPGSPSTTYPGARGEVALPGLLPGRYRVTLRCSGPAGAGESSQDFVVADVATPWVIIDGVEPAVVGAGGTVEVRFRAGGAATWLARTTLDVTRVSSAEGRVRVVAPSESFVLALEAEQQPGPTATTTITVDLARPIVLDASARDRVGAVELQWRLAQAERARVVREVGGEALLDVAVAAGQQDVVVPGDDRWLWLEASGPAGTTRRRVRIEGR